MSQTALPPLVSVLIPLYNHARYVKRCLDSVLEDSYPRLEILVIDDGSNDDSVALVQEWFMELDSSVCERFEIETRPNKGVTRTLNELVAKSRGDYLILLASDDLLLPGGIVARLDYLQAHQNKLAVFADCIVVDDEGVKTHDSAIVNLNGGSVECLANDKLLSLELICNWCVPGPGFMARRELYEIIGTYDETIAIEDWDMYLRIAARGALGFLARPVAAYRFHGGNSVLDKPRRDIHIGSLAQTAWKNYRAFRGAERFCLLNKYFELRYDKVFIQRQTMIGIISHKLIKLLYRLSFGIITHKVSKYLYRTLTDRYKVVAGDGP